MSFKFYIAQQQSADFVNERFKSSSPTMGFKIFFKKIESCILWYFKNLQLLETFEKFLGSALANQTFSIDDSSWHFAALRR